MSAKAPAPPKRRVSGFCNPTLPRTSAYDPHTRCAGCDCHCHQETPMPSGNVLLPRSGNESPEERLAQLVADGADPEALARALADPVASFAPSSEVANRQPDPLEDLTLEQAVELALAAAQRLSETAVDVTVEPVGWQDALDLLGTLRRAKWLLATVDDRLVRHVYLHGEHGKRLVEGVGEVYVGRSRAKEHWDERGVAQAVIDAKMADFDGAADGKLPDPWDVAEWLLEAFGVGYVRKTALDSLGIPREPFYTSEPGSLKVDLPKPASSA